MIEKGGGLKFLVDVGVGKGIENWLTENSYDTRAVRDINPSMPDREIVHCAQVEDRIILTMDKDFGDLVYHSKMIHAGVLLLRLEDERIEEKIRVVRKILGGHSEQLHWAFSVYQNGRLRIRQKPSVGS